MARAPVPCMAKNRGCPCCRLMPSRAVSLRQSRFSGFLSYLQDRLPYTSISASGRTFAEKWQLIRAQPEPAARSLSAESTRNRIGFRLIREGRNYFNYPQSLLRNLFRGFTRNIREVNFVSSGNVIKLLIFRNEKRT